MAAHEPLRSCIGCGEKRPRRQLHRLIRVTGDRVVMDEQATGPGRGGWVCGAGCLPAAVKRKAFGRAFRGPTQVDVQALTAVLVARAEQRAGPQSTRLGEQQTGPDVPAASR